MEPLTIDPSLLQSRARQAQATENLQTRDREKLKKSCQDFEAIFIGSLFKAMRKTVEDGGLFEKDTAHAIYQDMLDGEVAKEIAHNQSLGLAEQMYRQLERQHPGSYKVPPWRSTGSARNE